MIIVIIQILFQVFTFVILIDVILSFFMSPFHVIRRTLDAIVNPLLAPIRKVIPPIMNLDFSPVILIILLQIIESLLLRIV
jgi:YggT family protein